MVGRIGERAICRSKGGSRPSGPALRGRDALTQPTAYHWRHTRSGGRYKIVPPSNWMRMPSGVQIAPWFDSRDPDAAEIVDPFPSMETARLHLSPPPPSGWLPGRGLGLPTLGRGSDGLGVCWPPPPPSGWSLGRALGVPTLGRGSDGLGVCWPPPPPGGWSLGRALGVPTWGRGSDGLGVCWPPPPPSGWLACADAGCGAAINTTASRAGDRINVRMGELMATLPYFSDWTIVMWNCPTVYCTKGQRPLTENQETDTFRLDEHIISALTNRARRVLTHRSKRAALFDDFIGRSRESHRYVNAQRSGGLEVEDKFVFDRLHHWQFTRLLTFEDASHVDAGLPISIDDTSSIACQTASLDVLATVVHDRQLVARGE